MVTMKKKVLFIGLFLIATISVSFQFSAKRNNLESLMLENIDALASGEWETMPQCIGSGSVDCPNHVKVYFIIGQYSLEDLN